MSEGNGSSTVSPAEGGLMGSGTVGGLIAFYDYLVNKGLATASAVTPLKSASRQIFEIVEGTEDVDDIDVRSLNVDDYLDRFQVKAIGSGRYKPESITSYRKRFTRGMDYYSVYLTTGTVPKFKVRTAGGSDRKRQPTAEDGGSATPAPAGSPTPELTDTNSNATDLISYPFPLQTGGIATLRLPTRLERGDAERLAMFIRTLVFERQKQLPAQSNDMAGESLD